ncbi:MAG TPA: flagellar biosynthesis protein FlgL [Anaeromyxobacteraceae bacterium]|nr:flagellar biosynthesis protein FlgL [Anaeromyxobacteraceae bacterium]
MRISDQMMFDLATQYTDQAASNLQQAEATAASGLRVVHPGDDPTAAGILVGNQVTQARLAGIAATAGQAASSLGVAASALNTVSNTISQATQLALQMGNPTYNASERASAANQVNQYIQQIVAAMNSQVGDQYVFGGDQTGTAPFDAAGNYQGDTAVRQVEIAPGVTTDASVRADVALKGVGGGTDVLATLQSLSQALANNDTAGIQAATSPLNQGISQVSSALAQVGEETNALDTAQAANQAAVTAAKSQASSLADADEVQSATALAQAQQALQASLLSTSQGFQLSLLNYMT